MAYTQVTISGYNSNPPPDDGSSLASNNVTWAAIKSKLFDPIRTGVESVDDNIASAITTADSTLSTLQSGVTTLQSNVTSLSTTLNATAGTAMPFQQTSPPTGWSKNTTYNDYALRLVTGTISTGGSTAFTSVFASRTIATANLPSHTHSFSDGPDNLSFTTTTFMYDCNSNTNGADASGGSSRIIDIDPSNNTITGTYSFSVSTDSSGSGGGWDFAVQYVDLIWATKS